MARITPERLAAPGTEHAHQVALFCWASQQMHGDGFDCLRWLHAIPNGGERDRVVAGRMKAEGVKSGVWDMFLPVARGGYHGLYIEMKRPGREKEDRAGLSEKQVEFGKFILQGGYKTGVCYTWEQARDVILAYLA